MESVVAFPLWPEYAREYDAAGKIQHKPLLFLERVKCMETFESS